VVNAAEPYGSTLGLLDRSHYISSKQLLNCTHEAQWTLFQTHYFSENLVTPGTEPGPFGLYSGTLITRPQRRSTFFYITYINSVRTSQETQCISVQ
jgi:hypothetical protein